MGSGEGLTIVDENVFDATAEELRMVADVAQEVS